MSTDIHYHAHLLNADGKILVSGLVTSDVEGLCHFEPISDEPQLSPKEITGMLREGEGEIAYPILDCHISSTSGIGCQLHFRIAK